MHWDIHSDMEQEIEWLREILGLIEKEIVGWDTYHETVEINGSINFSEVMQNVKGIHFSKVDEPYTFSMMEQYVALSLGSGFVRQKTFGHRFKECEFEFDDFWYQTKEQRALIEKMSRIVTELVLYGVIDCWNATKDLEYAFLNGSIDLAVPEELKPFLKGGDLSVTVHDLNNDSHYGGYSFHDDYSDMPYDHSESVFGKSVFAGRIEIEYESDEVETSWDSEDGMIFELSKWPEILKRILAEHFDLEFEAEETKQKESDDGHIARAA